MSWEPVIGRDPEVIGVVRMTYPLCICHRKPNHVANVDRIDTFNRVNFRGSARTCAGLDHRDPFTGGNRSRIYFSAG